MATLNMMGPYALTSKKIGVVVERKSSGNYALGHVNEEKIFIVKYVGRSDDDVNTRLKRWVGLYKEFKFSYVDSTITAFEKECENFHDFGETKLLDNEIHPDRPDGSKLKCPKCDVYDNE